MNVSFIVDFDNHTAESLVLAKHYIQHEWHYKRSDYMWRERFNNHNRIYTYRNEKRVSYCEAFEGKDGTLRFTRTKRLD